MCANDSRTYNAAAEPTNTNVAAPPSSIENMHESIPRKHIAQVLGRVARLHLIGWKRRAIDGISINVVHVDDFLVEFGSVHFVRSHEAHRRILSNEGKRIRPVVARAFCKFAAELIRI